MFNCKKDLKESKIRTDDWVLIQIIKWKIRKYFYTPSIIIKDFYENTKQ